MRILFAASILPGDAGGINRSMVELAAGMRRRGHVAMVVYDSYAGSRAAYLHFPLRLLLRALRWGPDWVIARSTDGILCAAWSRVLGGMRVALHNHGWEESVYEVESRLPRAVITAPTTWKARAVRFPLLRLTLRLSDLCICGAIAEARCIGRKHPRARGGIALVPNGTSPTDAPLWLTGNVPPHFLCIGGPTWKKNIDYALAVFSRIRRDLPGARLFLVGAGESSVAEGLRDGVTAVGPEGLDGMERWYRSCPCLLAVSRYEGGRSLAVLEAMAHGLVVFVSPIPSTLEIVRDRLSGIVLPCIDPAVDASTVVRVVSDPAKAAGIRRAAWRCSVRHRWDRQVLRLEDALCRDE